MTENQKMHKKLIKLQNRNGKTVGKTVWIQMMKEKQNATSTQKSPS